MTPEHIKSLIAEGETLAVEFKSERGKSFSDNELVDAVVCLANRDGGGSGWLPAGVEDNGYSAPSYERCTETVRQRGFESLQQEQMVLQYVDTHGRITRKEVAELCRLGNRQASYLLKRLVMRHELKMKGAGRGAGYVGVGKLSDKDINKAIDKVIKGI